MQDNAESPEVLDAEASPKSDGLQTAEGDVEDETEEVASLETNWSWNCTANHRVNRTAALLQPIVAKARGFSEEPSVPSKWSGDSK